MNVLIEILGKQFKVEKGDKLRLPYVNKKVGEKLTFDNILYSDDGKTKKLVSICSRVNATCYISGISGRDYLDEQLFSDAKIKLIYENFIHPKYDQLYGNFLENMSVIDLLFNMGEQSVVILSKCKNFD